MSKDEYEAFIKEMGLEFDERDRNRKQSIVTAGLRDGKGCLCPQVALRSTYG